MAGAISQGITLLLYLILLNLFRIKSLSNNFLAFLYLLIAFQTVVILPFYSGGIQAHSVILPWLAMVPVISSLLSTFKQSLIWFFIILGAITAYAFIPDDLVSITYDQRYDKVFD